MKTIKTIKTGDVIQLKPEHIKETADRNKELQALFATIELLSNMIQTKSAHFWEFIAELYPETKKFNVSYDHKTGKILVKTKREETI